MTQHTGGTVTYHRAEWKPEVNTWEVQFSEHDTPICFTGSQGEAMGLTPEPAQPRSPTDVIASWWFSTDYCNQPEPFTTPVSESLLAALAEAGYDVVLRDARQDPQPASEPAPLSLGECLRGLLAGRTDADELLTYPTAWPATWLEVIGDAAREAKEDPDA